MIRRAFANLPSRQVHYRHCGAIGAPLVMLHASPGSSKQLEPLIAALGATRRVFAPDTAGNGDSAKLARESPEIADYAAATLEFMDAIGLETVDLYGSHTGASIATELAILAPDRIRRIVLDGVGVFSAEEREEYLAHYAPAIVPDMIGSHLNWAFMFCRDQYLFWPWYKHGRDNARGRGLPDARALHNWTLEVLKSIDTYHLAYRASFRYPSRDRLPLVNRPMLAIATESDPLLPNTRDVMELVPGAALEIVPNWSSPESMAEIAATIGAFLDA